MSRYYRPGMGGVGGDPLRPWLVGFAVFLVVFVVPLIVIMEVL
jgi:hypothetical protein